MPEPAPPLLFDARAGLGRAPGLHALIVGVGSYPSLQGGAETVAEPWDMGQLSSTASSAHRVYEWLRKADDEKRLPVPLATCRVLLSPMPAEAHLAGVGLPATLANFGPAAHAWRDDCKADRGSVAFFYFAGHGVQRTKDDAVFCLQEFRKPGFGTLFHSVALANLRGGMSPAPGFEEMARTQFYFFDACRVRPDRFAEFERMGTSDVFEVALAGKDDRCSPIFFGAISNQAAQALPGQQTLFSRAVLECLEGEAAEEVGETPAGEVQWAVTVSSLSEQLQTVKIDQLNRDFQADQTYAPGGEFRTGTICRLNAVPEVRLRLEVIPPEACLVGKLTLVRQGDGVVLEAMPPIDPHPYERSLPAGIYHLELSFDPPHPVFKKASRDWYVRPFRFEKKVKVG